VLPEVSWVVGPPSSESPSDSLEATMTQPKGSTLPLEKSDAAAQASMGGCLLRLCWMLAGNAALFGMAAWVSQQQAGSVSLADAAYWGVVVLLIAIRYLDIARFHGMTVEGEPATLAHWRRYAIVLTVVALGGWLLAHALGHR
jgi:hypothetical protein